MKSRRKVLLAVLIPVMLLAFAAAGYFIYMEADMSKAPDAGMVAADYMNAVCAGDAQAAAAALDGGAALEPAAAPASDGGKRLYGALCASRSYKLDGACETKGRSAQQQLTVFVLDPEKLSSGLNAEVNAALAELVAAAERSEDVYNADYSFKDETVERAYEQALGARLENAAKYVSGASVTLELRYDRGRWTLQNGDELATALLGRAASGDIDAEAEGLRAAATAELTYVRKIYTIEESALSGRTPDPACYGETDDPAVIEALLETPAAKQLIGERKMLWSRDIERIPGTGIRYYLDETILTLAWQEVEAQAVGTFSEVIIADGSQLRRKIAGDSYGDFNFETTSDFAADTNAVLALGGDFYNHGRSCGVVVYGREIYRFEPDTCDTCYISADGDMLFSYRGQFTAQEEAQAFIEKNDVIFSLCFGPVLIDNGVDVTPEQYQWGEVNDTYARSALGMLGERHYLTMNINCELPDHYYLATLRQAADAMLARGCIKAYTLDGGQTATTVFNGQLINPVQFGVEKTISDIIYFATAKP